jgi:hypothetical protein
MLKYYEGRAGNGFVAVDRHMTCAMFERSNLGQSRLMS